MQINYALRHRVEQEHGQQEERSQEKETPCRSSYTAEAHNCTQAGNEKDAEANLQRERKELLEI